MGNIMPAGGSGRKRRWAGEGENGVDEGGDEAGEWRRGKEKRTGMRMTWGGAGEPLSMLLCVKSCFGVHAECGGWRGGGGEEG